MSNLSQGISNDTTDEYRRSVLARLKRQARSNAAATNPKEPLHTTEGGSAENDEHQGIRNAATSSQGKILIDSYMGVQTLIFHRYDTEQCPESKTIYLNT